MQAFGWRQCISDKGKTSLANDILFALEIVIIADHPLSNMVEKMPTYTETTAKFLMFEQRICCIKVVLPKKEMPALSVAIQRRKVARNGATEQRPLAVEVVMDQHGANISSSSSDDESSESQRKL